MTMETQSRDASPSQSPEISADTPKPVSPQLPTPAAAEPPKKRPAFSISSILGEDDKPQTKIPRSSSPASLGSASEDASIRDRRSPVNDKQESGFFHGGKTTSPLNMPSTTPSRMIPPLGPQEAAKYNAFLAAAHLSNPDMAKLYRWPLLWGPWMGGVPGAGFPGGLPRPPLLQHSPVAALAQEGLRQSSRNVEETKDSLEAGEIIRPLACRRAPVIHDHHSPPKNHFSHQPHHNPLGAEPRPIGDKHSQNNTRSPSPSGRGQLPLPAPLAFQLPHRGHMGSLDALKLSNGNLENKNFSFDSDLDKDNEMVEIEIDEDVSDGEGNGGSRDDDDVLNKSNCERKKKTRTVFSRSQIFQLETMFDMKRYLSSSERAGLAKALNMTETQVKIWFQNRRNKWKRQIAAEMEAANMSQVTGQRLMQLPYMYSHEELSRGIRSSNMPPLSSLPPSAHPVVPPSVHHYYGNMLRAHTS